MTRLEGAPGCAQCYELNRDIRLALSSADTFAESTRVLLTILTHRPEFAYDRAAVFVRQKDTLRGFAAAGAADTEDVERLVQARAKDLSKALSDAAESAMRPSSLEQCVRDFKLSISDSNDPLVDALRTGLPVYAPQGLCRDHSASAASAGIIFPIFARGHTFAVVYADRRFSDRSPTQSEMWRAAALGNMIDDYNESDDLWIPTLIEPVGVLAERMLTVTRLAMRLAHHARNPLAVVGGFSHHLKSRIGDSAQAQRALDAIVQNTARLEDLIDDIPAYALSPDAEPEPIELGDVVADGIRSLPRQCHWSLDQPAGHMEVTTYAGIVAACVYIVGRYLATGGVVQMQCTEENGPYEIHFCATTFARTDGLEIMSVNQLMRMIGGESRFEADDHGRRFVISIPRFVHCPIVPAQGVERF